MIQKVILIICILSQVESSPNKLDKIALNGKWFVDTSGRVKLFRGINAVQKEFPWLPNNKQNDMTSLNHLSNLQKWGFNVVRLGVMWAGVMPEKNFINQTYLDEISEIVDRLATFEIYTLIDLHQDMMSSKFRSYDGVPLWLLNEMPKSRSEFPWPVKNETISLSLFSSYLTEACGFAFQCFYKNCNNFGDYFNEYWSIVAKKFSNNSAVLGYELINEPWAGDIYADPFLLLPSVAGNLNLLPLYDRAYETIRKYDSDTLVFYEPVTWGVLSDGKFFGTGFNRPPGNDLKKTVFSWHYYCWLLALNQNPIVNGSLSEFDRVLCDNLQLFQSYDSVKSDMIKIGNGASFLTEFGVCAYPDPAHQFLNTEECESILNVNDKYLVSWAYWDSVFYEDTPPHKVNTKLINIFSRVYPMVTNGIPEHLEFNSNSKKFTYTFTINMDKPNDETVIFVPDHVYPKGFKITVSDHLKWNYIKEQSLLIVLLNDKLKTELLNGKTNDLDEQSTVILNPF